MERDIFIKCQTKPDVIDDDKLISRDSLILHVEELFELKNKCVIIEGKQGTGKTLFSYEYAKKNCNKCISIFIKNIDKWGYDIEILKMDIFAQLYEYIVGDDKDINEFNETIYRQLIFKLNKKLTNNNEYIYFIVDGFDKIPESEISTKQKIIELLPLSFSKVRFIFTTNIQDSSIENYINKIQYKTASISGFSFEETKMFFSASEVTDESLKVIYELTRGNPEKLSITKDIIKKYDSIEKFLETSDFDEILEQEWSYISNDELYKKVLTILTQETNLGTINDISQILSVSENIVEDVVNEIEFLRKFDNGRISFVNESYRNFCVKRLNGLENEINNLIADYLFKDPLSKNSINYLPKYLEMSKRYDALIDYLSPYNFIELLAQSQSLYNVEQKVSLGVEIANKINRNEEFISLGVYKSIFLDFDKTDILKSELRACLALEDISNALDIAHSAITKDEKLHLLSIIARDQKEKKLNVDSEIIEQLNVLYEELNYEINEEKAIEVAEDLIYSCPELAIDLIESKKKSYHKNEENNLDLIFASMSLNAIGRDKKNEEVFSELNSRIKNDEIRTLPNKFAMLVGDYSAQQVLQEVSKFKNTTEKLFFLTRWSAVNKEKEDAYEVVIFALNLTIATTAYAPNAKIFSDLASPLPFMKDKEKIEDLIFKFENQTSIIEKIGPTEEYINFQVAIMRTLFISDNLRGVYKLIDIFEYIKAIKDLSIKTLCLATLFDNVQDLKEIEDIKELSLYEEIEENFDKSFRELLAKSADQYETSIKIISTLAKNTVPLAYKLIENINTEERMERALKKVIESIIDNDLSAININDVIFRIDSISNPRIKNAILVEILERLESENNDIDTACEISLRLTQKIYDINDLESKCYILCLWYIILNKKDGYEKKCDKILELLEMSWSKIDVVWNKVEIGYTIVSKISDTNIEFARSLFNSIKETKSEYRFISKRTAVLLIRAIQLQIRAFGGLIKKKKNTEQDLIKISSAIKMVPSYGEQAILWSDLALRCYKERDLNLFSDIINSHIRPLIQYIDDEDKEYKENLFIRLTPTLYFDRNVRTIEEIDNLIEVKKDEAYYRIAKFIFTKTTEFDPYDNNGKNEYSITYEEIKDLISILKRVSNELIIYYIVSSICTSIYRTKVRLTQNQKEEVKNELVEIVEKKLPNAKNIKHNGYKIICLAQIFRISKRKDYIKNLKDDTEEITNLSDKAYVLTILATLCKSNETVLSTKLLEEAKQIIDELPLVHDKIDLYESIANNAWLVNNTIARKCMNDAMKIAINKKGEKYHNIQRELIDMAYKLDQDLASSLASLADDDNVRMEVQDNIKGQVKMNNIKGIMSGDKRNYSVDKEELSKYSQAAWKLLASMNANRQLPVKYEDTLSFISKVADMPLTESYPILAWIIQNNICKYSNSEERVETNIKNYFEKITLGIDLIVQLSEKALGNIEKQKIISEEVNKVDSIIINSGEREKALDYLKEWIESEEMKDIIISDPFFGVEELELIKLIAQIKSDIEIKVLTSIKHQIQDIPKEVKIEDFYKLYWRNNVSDSEPPYCEITLVGGRVTNEPPIHDRWIIGEKSGLRLGTSFNSLGITKVSEISKITEFESNERKLLIKEYLYRSKKEYNGERLNYNLFTL